MLIRPDRMRGETPWFRALEQPPAKSLVREHMGPAQRGDVCGRKPFLDHSDQLGPPLPGKPEPGSEVAERFPPDLPPASAPSTRRPDL